MSTVQGLFDKYDSDSSGSLNYKEFTEALFSVDDVQPLPPAPQGKLTCLNSSVSGLS